MKKTLKRPDGSEETVEGTPEEVAAYERALRDPQPANESKKKPGVLRGKDLEEIQRIVQEECQRPRPSDWWKQLQPLYPTYPTWPDRQWATNEVRCPICGVYGCMTAHIWCGTTTSDRVELTSEQATENLLWGLQQRGKLGIVS